MVNMFLPPIKMVMTGGWFMTLFEPPDLPEISPGLYIAGGGSPSDDAESWQASALKSATPMWEITGGPR